MESKRRSFIRALWGIHDNEGGRHYRRREKMDLDMDAVSANQFKHEFKVYVFGEDNYRECVDRGFDCKLISKEPICWDMEKEQFRHKLEVFDRAMEDFDEIVFLDWDTLPVEPIPDTFWEKFYEKDSFQATLNQYKRRKAKWRKGDVRKLCCASFVYIRDKSITEGFIDKWEELGRPWSEELVMANYIDEKDGGWKGKDFYWERHEPHWFYLPRLYWAHAKEKILGEKEGVFRHFDQYSMRKILSLVEKGASSSIWKKKSK